LVDGEALAASRDEGSRRMTPERWQQIQDVLEKALELQPAQRSAYLNQACSSDQSLRQEVETLLASSPDVRSSFLRSEPLRVPLTSGTKLGEYEVKSLLGSGGMGEVYRARDSRLGRDVAIKVLPSLLFADSDRRRRFEQEARAAAALNHPNILAVFQLGTYEGAPYLVSELLEGETLRELTKRTRLSLRKAIDYGVQLAHGLAAAHEKGIVHRDLKPENLFVTRDGRLKILDFGLAKMTKSQSGSEHSALTLTEGTEAGVVMGTVGYMSPEQVRGQTADHRTDIFAFGAILYEVLAGKRAFQKPTSADTMSAILNEDPPGISQGTTNVPPALQRLVHRCLEKNPEQRFQSASDLAFALGALSEPGESAASATHLTVPGEHRKRILYVVSLAIVLLVLGSAFRWFKNKRVTPTKAPGETQLTHHNSENRLLGAAISPDGKHLAYTDTKGLHLSVIETGEIHDIPLPEELRLHLWKVSWLADGEKLLLTTEKEAGGYPIWVISIFGGTPRKLRGDSALMDSEASPQDLLIAFVGGNGREIWVMDANGENPRRILTSESERYKALAWSPTGRRLAYLKVADDGSASSVETVSLDGGPPSQVIADRRLYSLDEASILWVPDGRLLFDLAEPDAIGVDDAFDLWGIMTDPQDGKPSGKRDRITYSPDPMSMATSVSRDGRRLVITKHHIRLDVFVGELKEKGARLDPPTRLTVSESYDWPSAWTLDSKAVLFSSNRTGKERIFSQQLGQDTAEPLVQGGNEGAPEGSPELTPDGRWILYWSSPHGAATARVMRFPVSGGPPEQVMEFRNDDTFGFRCPFHHTISCVFSKWEQGQLAFYELDAMQGLGKRFAKSEMALPLRLSWSPSPDGLCFAISDWDQIPEQVRLLESRNGTERNLRLPTGWRVWDIRWTADGKALFVAAASRSAGYLIARVELDGKSRVLLNEGRNHWLSFLNPSPDGRHLAFGEQTFENNAWMLENF
jgi:eukaryotic-like serine/threonine-protein kinase